jgi:hypothetical protein
LRATPEVRAENEGTESGPDSTESRTYRLPLPPHPIAAEQARIIMRLALHDWNIPDIIDNALTITAELVANAAKTGDVFLLTLSRHDGGTVLIEVRDSSEACPDRRRRSVERVDGRGLLLVEACAKDWGWRIEDQGGKTVWAVVDTGTTETAPTGVRM